MVATRAAAAEAARMITFVIFVLHSDLPSSTGGEWWRPCPRLFAGVLLAAGPNIAICCRADLPLAHRTRRKDNDGMTKPSAKILVVDDDDEIRSLLQVVL